ncbi:MAG: DUF5103 domain-containing protein [Bacteroidales bacterium]|nr:DUF5103 domain-containing protein [Bacteroidales bacterium]
MKRLLPTLMALLCCAMPLKAQTLGDTAMRGDVKSVQLYVEGSELDFPVLTLGSNRRLVLEFDILRAEPESLTWHLLHCDRQWRTDGLDPIEFLNGFAEGTVDNYDFSFTTLTDYVHYSTTLPAAYAEFTHSGNYIVEVLSDTTPLLRRRFCVSEQAVKVEATVTRPYDGIDIDRRQEVDVVLQEGQQQPFMIQLRPEYMHVMVQQNGRLDNLSELAFSGYDGQGLAYRYRQENIFHGGNNFRYFDCSNLRTPMYNIVRVEEYGGETFAILRPEEDRSAKHYIATTTLNGGMKVNIWDRNNPRLEADYVWVNFSLPMAQPMLDGTVHIVGALTDWRLDSLSQMEYNPKYHAYTKRLLLKQGYYAYQLLVVPVHRPPTTGHQLPATSYPSATARLEGDHREAPNRYTVFVYHRSPSDRADRLVAVRRLANP